MRLLAEDQFGQDFEKAQLALHAEVYLDGELITRCVMADEEQGVVECAVPTSDPRWQGEFRNLDYWPTETKYGKVEIRDGRNKPAPSQED